MQWVYYRKAMEAGANSYLVKPFNSPENKTDLWETIKNVTQKALLKMNHRAQPIGNKKEPVPENTDHILEKLAAQYTLVVDLKAMRVYYKGILLPSGKDGLQQRYMAFLFILARDAGRAMSPEDIQKEIDELKLDKFQDRPNNIRNQIRKTLRTVARQHPVKNDFDEPL